MPEISPLPMDWMTQGLWIAIALFCIFNFVNLLRVLFVKELTRRQKTLFATIVIVPSALLLIESVICLLYPATFASLIADGIPRQTLLTIGVLLLLFVGLPLSLFSKEYAALSTLLDERKPWWKFWVPKKKENHPHGFRILGIVVLLIAIDIIMESILIV